MNASNELVSKVLNKISFSSVISEKSLLSDYFISRTGIYCQIPNFLQKIFIGGFSCKKNISEANATARFEAAERVLATYYCSDPNLKDNEYSLFSIFENKNIGVIAPEKVLLGPTLKNTENDMDAVGLGFHCDKQEAIAHAVYEFLERHLLGKIWYEDQQLIKISEETFVSDSGTFIVSDFTIYHTDTVPFVMTTLHDKQFNIFCIGAAFTNSMEKSRSKAKSEAIMLASDLLSNKSLSHISNTNSKDRMQSQKNYAISLRRKEYISSLIAEKNIINHACQEISLINAVNYLGLEENDICYTMLHESEYGYLARAVSQKLTTLREYRKIYAKTERYTLDAVC